MNTTKTRTAQHNPAISAEPAEVVLTEMDQTLWRSALALAVSAGAVIGAVDTDYSVDYAYASILKESFNKAGHTFLRRGDQFNDAVSWHLISESYKASDLLGDLGLLSASQEATNQRQPVLESPDESDPIWRMMNSMLTFGRQIAATSMAAGTDDGQLFATALIHNYNEVVQWLDGRHLHIGVMPLVIDLLEVMELAVATLVEAGYEISPA